MFWNYLKIALRNLLKNRLFSLINIVGLSVGLTVFLFGNILVHYETSHDHFFANSHRIYTIGNMYKAGAHLSEELAGNETFSALAPLIDAQLPEIEAVARTLHVDPIITMGGNSYFEEITYVDEEFLNIFDFNYLHGDSTALDDPRSVVITSATAMKYFGRVDVINELLNIGNRSDFRISGVIEDLPLNSHFKSDPDARLEILVPMEAYHRDINNQWNWIEDGDLTYVLLPEHLDEAWLEDQLGTIYESLVPAQSKEIFSRFVVSPLWYSNLTRWESYRIPLTTVVPLLGALILIIACANYANLSTAQSMSRSREVGMRKTMGATQNQLLLQFLAEGILIAFLAMLAAIAMLEITVSAVNQLAGKELQISYAQYALLLLVAPILVGVIAAAYPAWLISKTHPIDALRDIARRGKSGAFIRSLMIGAQFAISAFMLAVVAVVQSQNSKLEEDSYIFPRSEIYTLNTLVRNREVETKMRSLREELLALPQVTAAGFSSQVPYMGQNNMFSGTSQPGDKAGEFKGNQIFISPGFLETYDIPLLAGRNLDESIAGDRLRFDDRWQLLSTSVNILVNELVLEQLGISSHDQAIGQRMFDLVESNTLKEYLIVGVVPTQNINGLSHAEVPWLYMLHSVPETLSLRLAPGNFTNAIEEIEKVWKRVVPGYPMRGRFLDDVFEESYRIFGLTNQILMIFALIALLLAVTGLFGLATFVAGQRTREIGVRKILGANSLQIAKLLIWQISIPIIWALAIALPAAFVASSQYLNLFPAPINSQLLILLVAGVISILLGWTTVAGRVFSVARANPIYALRHE